MHPKDSSVRLRLAVGYKMENKKRLRNKIKAVEKFELWASLPYVSWGVQRRHIIIPAGHTVKSISYLSEVGLDHRDFLCIATCLRRVEELSRCGRWLFFIRGHPHSPGQGCTCCRWEPTWSNNTTSEKLWKSCAPKWKWKERVLPFPSKIHHTWSRLIPVHAVL